MAKIMKIQGKKKGMVKVILTIPSILLINSLFLLEEIFL